MNTSRKLEKLKEKNRIAILKAENTLQNRVLLESYLQEISDEYWRTCEIAGQAGVVLDEIDKEFQSKTGLKKADIILLFLCTALQCARQYVLSNEKFRFQDDVVDGKKKKTSSQKGDEFVEKLFEKTFDKDDQKAIQDDRPDWRNILFQSVPYDAISTSEHVSNTGLSGITHRYRTLGHDPVLGWIFGTANIMTNSLTTYRFDSYQVKNSILIRKYPLGTTGMMSRAVRYAEEKELLTISVARQAIHYGSDFFTKQGLPIPGVMVLNNDLAKEMISKWNIDSYSVVRGSAVATFINQVIMLIHTLFYEESRDGSFELYKIRTRRILNLSNSLATGSNVILTAVTKDMKKFDLGGLLVTLYRLVSDYTFIHNIKEDFLKSKMQEEILGEEYLFSGGNNND